MGSWCLKRSDVSQRSEFLIKHWTDEPFMMRNESKYEYDKYYVEFKFDARAPKENLSYAR